MRSEKLMDAKCTKKIKYFFKMCEYEVKRTINIGKKMLIVSKKNSTINRSYRELGRLVQESVVDKELDWKNTRGLELIAKIQNLEGDITKMEKDVYDIRFYKKKK